MNLRNSIPSSWVVAIVAPLLALVLILGFFAARGFFRVNITNTTAVSHSLILDKIQDVAKLVSTEYVLRDVIVYENTWYGSTKKSLIVATGKVLAGIDLSKKHDVTLSGNKIQIRLPHATALATDITDLQTYDEKRGWWNPFLKEDHDAIYQTARGKFMESSRDLRLRERAEESARRLLKSLLARDGYTVEVTFE
jgi:hypothetical protein